MHQLFIVQSSCTYQNFIQFQYAISGKMFAAINPCSFPVGQYANIVRGELLAPAEGGACRKQIWWKVREIGP